MANQTALMPSFSTFTYERHRPEETLLYALIEEHYPRFLERLEAEGTSLPRFVKDEFAAYLKCGRLEHGFLRVKCNACQHELLVAFSCKRPGFCPSCGARRMVETAAHLVDHVLPEQPIRQWVISFPYPLIGSSLNPHAAHSTFTSTPSSSTASIPSTTSVHASTASRHPATTNSMSLLHTIASRVTRALEKQGLLIRDAEQPYLDLEPADHFEQLLGSAIHYRIATGPHAGNKALTLRTVPPATTGDKPYTGHEAGLPIHAGTVCQEHERGKLERLCRYGGHGPGQPRAPPQLSLGLGAPSSEQLPFFV